MLLKYLGTGAAEGIPALFCTCETCKKAAAAGGRNIRTRSQAVINDDLLIDFPADTYIHVLQSGLNLPAIHHCIITHDHGDHLYPEDFAMRGKWFAELSDDEPFTVYGTVPTNLKLQQIIREGDFEDQKRLRCQLITPFVPFEAAKYTVTPLKADHAKLCEPVMYAIGDGNKNLLYAHDSGYFPDETWAYLESRKPYFNYISLDCTFGPRMCRTNHMGLETNAEVRERLIKIGCADINTVFCINHITHFSKVNHDELVEIAKKQNFLVAYDGMTVEI